MIRAVCEEGVLVDSRFWRCEEMPAPGTLVECQYEKKAGRLTLYRHGGALIGLAVPVVVKSSALDCLTEGTARIASLVDKISRPEIKEEAASALRLLNRAIGYLDNKQQEV